MCNWSGGCLGGPGVRPALHRGGPQHHARRQAGRHHGVRGRTGNISCLLFIEPLHWGQVLCEPTPTARKETAARIVGETGGKLVHPYDDYTVMAGQGTVGLELAEQVTALHYTTLLVRCGSHP